MGHGKTNVGCWTYTPGEEFGLQEDLAVSNGNDLIPDSLGAPKDAYTKTYIGRDVSGHVTTMGLDDRKRSE
jgi:hypothetical protein